jgi:hypothetical protein
MLIGIAFAGWAIGGLLTLGVFLAQDDVTPDDSLMVIFASLGWPFTLVVTIGYQIAKRVNR